MKGKDIQEENSQFALGFLSPFIWDLASETAPYNREWEVLTNDINVALLHEWRKWSPEGRVLEAGPIKNRLLAKCISSFQAAIILARFGMVPESKTLSRVVFEAAFWIQYFVVEPDQALKDFKNSENSSLSEQCEALAKVVPKEMSPRYIAAAEAWKEKSGNKNPLGPKRVHKNSNLDDSYYAYYKHLCAFAAHPSISSIESYLDISDVDGAGHVITADFERSNKAYFFALHAALLALAVHANPDASEEMKQYWMSLMARLETLSTTIAPFE